MTLKSDIKSYTFLQTLTLKELETEASKHNINLSLVKLTKQELIIRILERQRKLSAFLNRSIL